MKKYFILFEQPFAVFFSSFHFDCLEDARKVFYRIVREEKDPLIIRVAVGCWDEIPFKDGNVKIFHVCLDHKFVK